MKKVLVTGSSGFIGGYIVEELLSQNYQVVGLDNLSKYGRVRRSYDDDDRYTFIKGDATDKNLLADLMQDCDHVIAGAALIGGISYFHTYPYDLLSINERIIAATCDAAIATQKNGGKLEKVTYISSSMVFESTDRWPSVEGDEQKFHRQSLVMASKSLLWSILLAPLGINTNYLTQYVDHLIVLELGKVVHLVTKV